jgi:hypothetical protein
LHWRIARTLGQVFDRVVGHADRAKGKAQIPKTYGSGTKLSRSYAVGWQGDCAVGRTSERDEQGE